MSNNEFPGRRSIRLKEYDYSLAGGYFVTIVTLWREFLFGEIVGGEMQFNALGRIVEECWQAIPEHFPNTDVEVFVVMPNHVHGIIIIHNETRRGTMPIVGARHATSTRHTARFSWRNRRLIQILRHTARRTGIEFRQHLATKLL